MEKRRELRIVNVSRSPVAVPPCWAVCPIAIVRVVPQVRARDGAMTSRTSCDSAIKISRWLLCSAGLAALGVGGLKSLHAGERIDADRQKYAEQMEQTYSYRFGKGQAFPPSNANI